MQQDESAHRDQGSRPDLLREPHARDAADSPRIPPSGVVAAFVNVNDRVIHNLHECALALTTILHDRSVISDHVVETLHATIETLDGTIRDLRTTAFAARQYQLPDVLVPGAKQRYVVRIEDQTIIAYASEGHTFRRVLDDTLWAHEVEGVLLSARSGAPLAHRVGNTFYDAVTNLALYYELP